MGANNFKVGDLVKVSPDLTKLKNWVVGNIINIRENPFLGTEIAIKDKLGRIFFGEAVFFRSIDKEELCSQ